MRSTVNSILIVLFAISALAQQKTDLQNQVLNGKVKSVSLSSLASDGKTERLIEMIHFNTKGMIADRAINDDKGRVIGTTTYSYDTTGRLTKTSMVDQQDKIIEEQTVAYDDANHMKTIKSHGADSGEVSMETYKLDDTGNAVRIQHSDGKKSVGTTHFKTTGNTVEMTFTGPDGKPAIATVGPCLGAQKVVLKKDASGTVLAQSAYDLKGVVKNQRTYTYDAKMHATSMLVESPNSKVKYDYTYEFDVQGNWTKQINQPSVVSGSKEVLNHSASGGAKHALLRKIEYY
jgi:hypothetical protein